MLVVNGLLDEVLVDGVHPRLGVLRLVFERVVPLFLRTQHMRIRM